jgi:hypothetical protein
MRRFLAGSLLMASVVFVACSNKEPRKNSNVPDGSNAEGASGAGGQGGDAAVDSGTDVALDGPAEATPDAPADVPEETGLCPTGDIYDFQNSTCFACTVPSDAGEAGPLDGGTQSDAGTNPYRATLECSDLLAANVSYDAVNNVLVVDTGYPLQVQQVSYDVVYTYEDSDGGWDQQDYPGSTTDIQGSVIDITLPQLPAGFPEQLQVNGLTLVDTCGRTTQFSPDVQGFCSSPNPPLFLYPSFDGGTWTPQCAGPC